ncbi:MAG: iron chelate uptake ABC transporter family permease subunit [Rhabdochlamydiaceae bacterium]|jgi:manganese/zinc/iron transport system permease protein
MKWLFSSPWLYFTDPVLQAPTIGSMLMCLSSALVGVVVFLRKRSLLGEALSHATYPGVVLSVLFMALFFPLSSDLMALAILIGAFLTSLLGLWVIEKLERRFHVKNDAALCFVLSVFFGFGVLVASRIQYTHALWYKTVQIFLYGQAATMTDIHVFIYATLAIFLALALIFLYRQIEMVIFDRDFSKTVGVAIRSVDGLLFVLLLLAIVIGIRSVGVVLMAGMLIAPAVAARQLTHRLWAVFLFAAAIGAISGFLGNYLSVEIPAWGSWKVSLPTGPMILLSASTICFFSLLFAPQNGLISRLLRILYFQKQRMEENLLKYFWRRGIAGEVTVEEIKKWQPFSPLQIHLLLWRLKRQGWIEENSAHLLRLTKDGYLRATHIVRLHRLWEAYLVFLGQGAEKVHRNAEEMEHIITPQLEKQLAELLGDPKQDPHAQPIPPKESRW